MYINFILSSIEDMIVKNYKDFKNDIQEKYSDRVQFNFNKT